MNAQLKMCCPAMSEILSSVTGSRALQSGAMPCALPIGQTTGKSGLEVAHASRLAQQDKAKDLQIPATCGRSGWS